jgi:hypothetical protein
MADRFIGINNNGGAFTGDSAFTVGSSTGSTDVEVRFADDKEWTRETLQMALEAIGDYLATKSEYPVPL